MGKHSDGRHAKCKRVSGWGRIKSAPATPATLETPETPVTRSIRLNKQTNGLSPPAAWVIHLHFDTQPPTLPPLSLPPPTHPSPPLIRIHPEDDSLSLKEEMLEGFFRDGFRILWEWIAAGEVE